MTTKGITADTPATMTEATAMAAEITIETTVMDPAIGQGAMGGASLIIDSEAIAASITERAAIFGAVPNTGLGTIDNTNLAIALNGTSIMARARTSEAVLAVLIGGPAMDMGDPTIGPIKGPFAGIKGERLESTFCNRDLRIPVFFYVL